MDYDRKNAYRPLADELRPRELSHVVGQEHILGEGGILRRIIEGGKIPNMIFYGPSGVGKTTVAGIISQKTNRSLRKLNATTAGIGDIKAIIGDLDTFMTPGGVLLYLDEIQYFNKKQQQSLLEFMESGAITLIASTTENPYFYVYNAVLSRSTVFEFKQISPEAVYLAVERAVAVLSERREGPLHVEEGVLRHVALASGGDVRKALNAVELLFSAAGEDGSITLKDAQVVTQQSAMRYDRDGDAHYDILSAFQKSIRGSDPDAALHYLARLLEAGDLISPCRRLLVTAAEDIGLAHPQALSIVKACVDAARELGLPEARIPLADATVLLATSPKSNTAYAALDAAIGDIRAGLSGDVPDHLKDSHYAGAAKLGRGKGYKYSHDYPNRYTAQQYLPDPLAGTTYYQYGDNKVEQAAKKYWDLIKNQEEER